MTEGQRVAAVLRRAVAKMNDGGKHWKQHSLRGVAEDGKTSYCALGGIRAVTRSTRLQVEADRHLAAVISRKFGTSVATFYIWNDSHARKWSQVKAAFEKAAKLAEKEPA